MRISDWSSDVCSSDLADQIHALVGDIGQEAHIALAVGKAQGLKDAQLETACLGERLREGFVARHGEDHTHLITPVDRKRVVEGKSVSVRVDHGGRRIIKKKTKKRTTQYMRKDA